jgi:hypothetical protein
MQEYIAGASSSSWENNFSFKKIVRTFSSAVFINKVQSSKFGEAANPGYKLTISTTYKASNKNNQTNKIKLHNLE